MRLCTTGKGGLSLPYLILERGLSHTLPFCHVVPDIMLVCVCLTFFCRYICNNMAARSQVVMFSLKVEWKFRTMDNRLVSEKTFLRDLETFTASLTIVY